jgi:hypothetical protein
MCIIEFFYALKLNDYFPFNDQIYPETFIEPVSLVFKCNRCLPLYNQAPLLQLICHCDLVYRFKQSGSKLTVNFNRSFYDRCPYLVFCHQQSSFCQVARLYTFFSRRGAENAEKTLCLFITPKNPLRTLRLCESN